MRPGRPSKYSEELTTEICRRLAAGESLRAICRDEDMPARETVLRWIPKHEEFRHQYAHARELQSEGFAEEIVAIADEIPDKASHEQISRAKVQIDSRKWIASRLLPKKYGRTDKHEFSGPGGGPIPTEIAVTLVSADDDG